MIDYLKKILEDWEHSLLDFLPKIVLAVAVFFLFFILARIVKKISFQFYSKIPKSNPDIAKIIAATFYFFFLLSGVFISFEILGLGQILTKLFAGAGVVGIVAGFAFKDIASNAFAGLLINMQRPFKVGDWVGMDGAYGTILKISWMTTAIKSTSGQEVYVPNQIIYSNIFTNYSTFNKRCITLHSSVPFASDLEHVKTVVLDEVNKVTGVLKDDGIDFFYTEIGDTAFNFEISFWIKFSIERDYQQAMSDIIISIKNRFEKENIQIV